jgi:5-methylcytosine-specific restriction endonuclease McrA
VRRERAKAARRVLEHAQRPPDGCKLCCRCHHLLTVASFTRNRRKRDGLEPWCRNCERARKGATPRWVDPAPENAKTCATCREVKPLDAFYKERRSRGRGVVGSCRDCCLAAAAPRRRARGISERPVYDDPAGFKTCRRCKTLKPVSDFGPEKRNRDGIKSWCGACHNERTIEWHGANPQALARLKAVRRGAEDKGVVSDRDWLRLLDRWGWACAYCGSQPELLHHDHVIPVARAGSHSIGNLLPACQPCNSSKGSRLLVEWRYTTDRRRFTKIDGMQRILVRL